MTDINNAGLFLSVCNAAIDLFVLFFVLVTLVCTGAGCFVTVIFHGKELCRLEFRP
ncbi:MAG: hypothetical protein ACI3YA_02340 [Alloprevotella sp.]